MMKFIKFVVSAKSHTGENLPEMIVKGIHEDAAAMVFIGKNSSFFKKNMDEMRSVYPRKEPRIDMYVEEYRPPKKEYNLTSKDSEYVTIHCDGRKVGDYHVGDMKVS